MLATFDICSTSSCSAEVFGSNLLNKDFNEIRQEAGEPGQRNKLHNLALKQLKQINKCVLTAATKELRSHAEINQPRKIKQKEHSQKGNINAE